MTEPTPPIKRAGPLTYLTIAILVAFGITDLAAEVTGTAPAVTARRSPPGSPISTASIGGSGR
jgi:hypothetical protein